MKKRNNFSMVLISTILVLFVFSIFSRTAAAQPAKEEKEDHWEGLRIETGIYGKLPYFLRMGAVYTGGTDGQPHAGMVTLGQSFPLPRVILGYHANLSLRKQSFEGIEGKELGAHATFEYERARIAAAARVEALSLPWGEVLPIVTYILRGQGTLTKAEKFEFFLGGELFGRNENFDLGLTAGFRFKRIPVFGRQFDAILSVTDMTAFALAPQGVVWTNRVILRGGLVFDFVPPERDTKEDDRPREYGQL